MDWGSVLEDSGEESLEGRFESKTGSRLSFLKALAENTYTPTVAYLFTVNYILGIGALGMPYAFFQAGVVLATFILAICSVATYVTTLWLANAIHRVIIYRQLERGRAFGEFHFTPKNLSLVHSIRGYLGDYSSVTDSDSPHVPSSQELSPSSRNASPKRSPKR